MPAAGRAGQFSISATLIFCYSASQGAAGGALGDVFGLGGCDGLPLHVGGVVGATSAQRLDVVGDPAGAGGARFAGGRAGVEAFEGNDGGCAARCGLRFGMLRQCDDGQRDGGQQGEGHQASSDNSFLPRGDSIGIMPGCWQAGQGTYLRRSPYFI